MALYFIGILAPRDIQQVVLGWKHYMLQRFGCRNALKSPAHITLIPPFELETGKQQLLNGYLDQFSVGQVDFSISIRNFSHFGNRVIFASVEDNPDLQKLQTALESWLGGASLFHLKDAGRSFHPHITIANRDLDQKDFFPAWNHFSLQTYSAHFKAGSLSLLLHDANKWNLVHSSGFQPEPR
jgi:2'-5' RNA ligase